MANEQPLISVIIPAYNRAHCIANTLYSALEQTYRNFEIIVVNDGSADETAQVVGNIALRHSSVRLVNHETNRGVSAARNTGIFHHARGEYIALLDSDDLWHPTKMEKQIAALLALPEEERKRTLSVCDYMKRSKDGREEGNYLSRERNTERAVIAHTRWVGNGSSSLAHRDVYLNAGGFDTKLSCYEDIEWGARHVLKGGHIRVLPEVLFTYSWDPNKFYPDFTRCSNYFRDKIVPQVRKKYGAVAAMQMRSAFHEQKANVHWRKGEIMGTVKEITLAFGGRPIKTSGVVLRFAKKEVTALARKAIRSASRPAVVLSNLISSHNRFRP
jgi:glycosyltransferase involved in cell wall biosynthesis